MKRILVSCLVLLVLFGMPFSVKAADAGSITLDFSQFIDQMEMVNQSERPSYGVETTATVKSTEFTSMNIIVVKVEDRVESTCWESNITSLENISIDLDSGTYKVYTQLEGDDTVLEYNNDSEGYVIAPQSHLVIPMAYPPYTEGYILDIPWRIEDSEMSIPILAVDTGVYWADIWNIYVYDHNNGDSLVASTNWESLQPINSSNTPFFHLLNINKDSFVQVDGDVSIKIKFDLWGPFDNWEGPINVRISLDDIPKITDWYCGDTHLHTNYTYNVYEFGAPIYATKAANNAMGLDWMIVTDHSFDLDPDKWNVSSADCDAHSDNLFRVLQGEEVSCYLPGTDTIPGSYQYNHLLVYGADFILGGEWEDGTGSDYTPAEAIAIANSQGGVTYPAHPFYDDPFRDPWRNYSLNFNGLQVWNHLSDEPTHLPDGLAKWSELLLGGRHVYIEGGTDAHGDFNTIAGKVKTYVYAPGYSQSSLPPRSEILNALRNGHSMMTDGPLVAFDINGEVIGNNVSLTNGTNATLHIQWNSTQEFGYIDYIIVKKGVINGTEETNVTIIPPSSIGKDNLSDEHELIISPNESCYYRVEAYSNTTNGEQYRCYTNPIWVDVLGTWNGDHNVIEVGETNYVLIGQKLRFQGDDLYHCIVGKTPDDVEGVVVGTATDDYDSGLFPMAGTYFVDMNDNAQFDVGETVLCVAVPIIDLKITVGGIPVSAIVEGTNFTINLTTNLDWYDSIGLKVLDPDGFLLNTNPANHSQVFDNLTVGIVKDMVVYTKDWKIGTYQIWVKTNRERAQGLDISSSVVALTLFEPAITIEAEKCELAKFEWDNLTVMGIPNHNITIDSSDPAHTIFPIGIGDNPFTGSIPFNDTIDGDGIRTYTVYFNDTGVYTIKVTDTDAGIENTVNLTVSWWALDTGLGTYPSIAGVHNGTITPNQTLRISKLYTYPCTGTGGHTEYAAFYYLNGTTIAEAYWDGYVEDWHNISFDKSFTLLANETYNYTIRTGSYPQIIHEQSKEVTGGTITCIDFEDSNGKTYTDWIPAIMLL